MAGEHVARRFRDARRVNLFAEIHVKRRFETQ